MRLKFFFTIFYLLIGALAASSQVTYKELNRFFKFSSQNLNISNSFKDSLAMYTCNIQITVEGTRNAKPILCSTDTSVSNKILQLDTLLSYDYSRMIGKNKKVKFILPISIIILDSKYDPKLFDAHDIFLKVSRLYYFNKEKDDEYKFIHLNPISVMVDKKSYH